jgi:hypothetical protein
MLVISETPSGRKYIDHEVKELPKLNDTIRKKSFLKRRSYMFQYRSLPRTIPARSSSPEHHPVIAGNN